MKFCRTPLFIALGILVFLGLILLFGRKLLLSNGQWKGGTKSIGQHLFIPTYIRTLPRINLVGGSENYTFDEEVVGFACLEYQSSDLPEELLAATLASLDVIGFNIRLQPDPSSPQEALVTNDKTLVGVSTVAADEGGSRVNICDYGEITKAE